MQALNLDHTQVTDAGLEHLKGLADLRELSLYSTKIAGKGLRHLKTLANLRKLYLGEAAVSDVSWRLWQTCGRSRN